MKAVIFAGGIGKRLWPLSRENQPKQIQPMFGESSLKHSLDLLKKVVPMDNIYIATGIAHKDEILETVPEMKERNLYLESSVKDTGPAISYTMTRLILEEPDEPIMIRWQNSIIKDPETFARAAKASGKLLNDNSTLKIVHVAVPSKYPNTNVGWIKKGEKIADLDTGVTQYRFIGFKEKPEMEEAVKLHEAGHGWNPGCYVTTPQRFLSLVEETAPDLYEKLIKIKGLIENGEDGQKVYEIYDQIEPISVDYLIWEYLPPESTGLILADYDWWYVSTWHNVLTSRQNDPDDNVTEGNTELLDTKNTLVYNDEEDFLIATIGIEGLCVVKHKNAVLVCKNEDAAKVKDLFNQMKDEGKNKFV